MGAKLALFRSNDFFREASLSPFLYTDISRPISRQKEKGDAVCASFRLIIYSLYSEYQVRPFHHVNFSNLFSRIISSTYAKLAVFTPLTTFSGFQI